MTYPRVVEHSEYRRPGWLQIAGQDGEAPPGEFRTCRVLHTGPFHNGVELRFNIAVTLYRNPPREWPPRHMGASSAGMNLTDDEARALRDALDEYLSVKDHDPAADAAVGIRSEVLVDASRHQGHAFDCLCEPCRASRK